MSCEEPRLSQQSGYERSSVPLGAGRGLLAQLRSSLRVCSQRGLLSSLSLRGSHL